MEGSGPMNFSLALIVRETAAAAPDRPAVLHHPRAFEFRDVLPKNTRGKVLKDELVPRRVPGRRAVHTATAAV